MNALKTIPQKHVLRRGQTRAALKVTTGDKKVAAASKKAGRQLATLVLHLGDSWK